MSIAFSGREVTYDGVPAGTALFADMADGGVCVVWTRPDGVSERQDWPTAEQAELALIERVRAFYGAMN